MQAGDNNTSTFLRLFSAHQQRLHQYVFSLVADWNDAEDIVQEVAVKGWENFDQFTEGTHFFAWISKIGFHQVQAFRKQRHKSPLPMSEQFLELTSAAYPSVDKDYDIELESLRHCISMLGDEDRVLLEKCYDTDTTIKEVAQKSDAPAGTIYKALSRIRHRLLDCIQRRMAGEGRP